MNAADTLPQPPSTPAIEHASDPAVHEPAVHEPASLPAGLSPEQTAERLVQMFPALFGPEGPRLPIKLRIQADIQQRAPDVFSRRALSYVLSHATTRTAYLKRLVQDTQRYDLDGQPAGEIAPEHRQAAVDELARRKGLFDARRATQRAAANGRVAAPGDSQARPDDGAPPQAPAHAPRRPPVHAAAAPRGDQARQQGRHQERHQSPMQPRGQGPAGARPGQRPPRPTHPQQPNPAPSADRAQPVPPRAEPAHDADPARRERALLLRAFESSPLSKANFCALKRLDPQTLEAQLELARQERSAPR